MKWSSTTEVWDNIFTKSTQTNIPSEFCQEIGSELSALKNELTSIWEKVSSFSLPSGVNDEPDPLLSNHTYHCLIWRETDWAVRTDKGLWWSAHHLEMILTSNTFNKDLIR